MSRLRRLRASRDRYAAVSIQREGPNKAGLMHRRLSTRRLNYRTKSVDSYRDVDWDQRRRPLGHMLRRIDSGNTVSWNVLANVRVCNILL